MEGTSKKQKQNNPEREFIKLFENLTMYRDRVEIFHAFLDYSLIYFKLGACADDFGELEKRWSEHDAMSKFKNMFLLFGEMADKSGAGFHDCLGDIFMETISRRSASYKGQFFTPIPICDFMAQVTHGDDLKDGMRVSDPACGSGRTLLAMAKLNRNLLFYAADVDQMCCKMTALNMLVNSLTCEVAWMNSLSLEHYDTWHTGHRPFAGKHLPYYVKVGKEQTFQLMHWEQGKKEKPPGEDIIVGKRNQIELF